MIRELIEEVKDYIYWHYVFPHLDYTKKNFDKKQVANGTLFIRIGKWKKKKR